MSGEYKYTKICLLRYLKWLSDKLNEISIISVILMLLSMTFIVFAQVISRYLFKNSISWSEEIARWLMIWIVFLGSGIAVKYGEHIGLSFIFDRFQGKVKATVSLLINIGILIFLYFCVVKSFAMYKFIINQKTAAAMISMAWPFSAVPVGSIIMAVHIILFMLENICDILSSGGLKNKL